MVPVIVLTVTGVLMALAIGIIVKYFGAKPDPRAEAIGPLMPGANCGGCGFAGCNDYMNALLCGKAKPGHCPSMSAENVKKLAAILGEEADEVEPMMAVVLCSGDDGVATKNAMYNGVNDCRNALLVAGASKSCSYGCLGMGTCARACPHGAIEITEKRLAKVHPELCVGCGKCISACPRGIVKLVPRSLEVAVFCSSPLAGKIKMKQCKAACIGCHKCGKAAQPGQMNFNGFLASVNLENPPDAETAEKAACPTHCFRKIDPAN